MKSENPYSSPQSNDFIPIAQQIERESEADSPSSLRLLTTAVGILVGIFAACKVIEWLLLKAF
jgi:hypothetical protein